MAQVPSNLIPTRVTQLPVDSAPSENGLMMYVRNGVNYQVRVGDLLSVAGVPLTRQVIAGTSLTGGGQLSSNVTLSVAPKGVSSTELSDTGVTAGLYGSSTNIPSLTIGADGRVEAASQTGIELARSGANADITSMSAVTGGISSPTFIQLDPAGDGAPVAGKIQWDPTYGTTTHGLTTGVKMLDGMDMVAFVTNAEANTLLKGEIVYLYGAQGNRATVKRASNTGDPTSSKTMGIVKNNIGANASGYIVTQGVVDGINLGAYNEGDVLWLSSTPGAFTNVKPVAPNHLVFIGIVERANAGNGQVYVKTQNGYELDELHDVRITSLADHDFLQYAASSSVWVNTPTPRLRDYTVATLPAAGTLGRIACVTDATAPTYLGTLTGGGSVKTPVFDNGTAWVSY